MDLRDRMAQAIEIVSADMAEHEPMGAHAERVLGGEIDDDLLTAILRFSGYIYEVTSTKAMEAMGNARVAHLTGVTNALIYGLDIGKQFGIAEGAEGRRPLPTDRGAYG